MLVRVAQLETCFNFREKQYSRCSPVYVPRTQMWSNERPEDIDSAGQHEHVGLTLSCALRTVRNSYQTGTVILNTGEMVISVPALRRCYISAHLTPSSRCRDWHYVNWTSELMDCRWRESFLCHRDLYSFYFRAF
jgi:hypothetical protein